MQDNYSHKKRVVQELGIPLDILATSDGKHVYEVETHLKILGNSQVFLDSREQLRNVFLTYYNGDYIKKVQKFMKRKDFVVIQGGRKKYQKK